jgi:hypothetical protein
MTRSRGPWLFVLLMTFLTMSLDPLFEHAAGQASGQEYRSGYQFGAGLNFAGATGWVSNGVREQLPYFAQFPPVYYSHILPRPYGISPFAAPPGIMPIEMSIPVSVPPPKVISNPYFNQSPTPATEWPPDELELIPESSREAESRGEPESAPPLNSDLPKKAVRHSAAARQTTSLSGRWQTNPFYFDPINQNQLDHPPVGHYRLLSNRN